MSAASWLVTEPCASAEASAPNPPSGIPPATAPGTAAVLSRFFGELAGGGSWEAPAGAVESGIGSTVLSTACWRMCSRKEFMNSGERGAAPVGDGLVPSSSGASPGDWTLLSIGEESMPVRGDVCEARGAAMGGGCGVLPLLVHRAGARRVRAITDICIEWPERRGSSACRETRGCRGQCSGRSTVASAGVVACGRYWGGRGVLPLACHGVTLELRLVERF